MVQTFSLYLNSVRVYIRLIYASVYSVISVNDKRLPGNTKKWTLVRLWLIRVRLVHSWAVRTKEPTIESKKLRIETIELTIQLERGNSDKRAHSMEICQK